MKTLIVDDHAIFRKMVEKMLPVSHKVLQAGNGVDAIELARANPDLRLILTDHNMPKLKGLEFVKVLYHEGLLTNVTVIFLTSERDKKLMSEAESLGIKNWLPKPFKKEELIKALENVS